MTKVIGVRFKKIGKVYFFKQGNYDVKLKEHVIVDTAMGQEYAEVVMYKEVDESKIDSELKPIKKVATEKNTKQYYENKEKAKEAYNICLKNIKSHGLKMKLLDAEIQFDNSKILFYFTADGRIDFRDLVKDLATIFKTRIELRQVGVRDEVKKIGGNGVCGRELCCCSFYNDFEAVSIKMAKEQNISFTPSKISGNCGRLMCCLRYEQEVYEEKNAKLPTVGSIVSTEDGEGIVEQVEILKEIVKVKFKDKDGFYYKKFPAKDIKVLKKAHQNKIVDPKEQEELKEL